MIYTEVAPHEEDSDANPFRATIAFDYNNSAYIRIEPPCTVNEDTLDMLTASVVHADRYGFGRVVITPSAMLVEVYFRDEEDTDADDPRLTEEIQSDVITMTTRLLDVLGLTESIELFKRNP